jgi:hypothetical protein
MFCRECGKEMSNMAIACPNCGCGTANTVAASAVDGVPTAIIVLGYVFSILFSLIGLVIGIVVLVKGSSTQKAHGIAITAMSAIFMLLGIVIMANS